jgi:hypothetical protein
MDVKELISSNLEMGKEMLERTLDGLSADEMNWHPRPDANSIALILFHICRFEDSIISRMSGQPSLWDTGKLYAKFNKDKNDQGAHYTAEQVENFTLANTKELIAFFKAARARALDFVNNVSPDRYDEKVDMPAPPPPPKDTTGRPAPPKRPEPTIGRMMGMVLTHFTGHAAEISYIRGLKRGLDR